MFFQLIFPSFILIWLGCASVGRHFWLHQKYIDALLKVFEYGRKRIEKVNVVVKQRQRKLSKIHEKYEEEDQEEEEEEEEGFNSEDGIHLFNFLLHLFHTNCYFYLFYY